MTNPTPATPAPRRTFEELLAAMVAAPAPKKPAAKCRCRRCNTLFVMNGHYQSAQTLAQRRFLMDSDPVDGGKYCRDCVPTVYDLVLAGKAAAKAAEAPEAEATGTDDVQSPF